MMSPSSRQLMAFVVGLLYTTTSVLAYLPSLPSPSTVGFAGRTSSVQVRNHGVLSTSPLPSLVSSSSHVLDSFSTKAAMPSPLSKSTQRQNRLEKMRTKNAVADVDESQSRELFQSPFKGIVSDIKRKKKFYPSDFIDGMNLKAVASTFFMFFACLAPAVAFGGLMGKATGGQIGTMEMILATAYNGVIYAALSGQPLTIIGSTGPVLAFTLVLYNTAVRMGLPFLPLYSWVGIWTSLILFLSSITSLSNLVNYFTRFTDEIFSLLISLIFIFEACKDLTGLVVSPTFAFGKALLSVVIAATTLSTATNLAGLRRSPYFTKKIRNTIADFAPTIGVVTGCYLAKLAATCKDTVLPNLVIPAEFATTSGRPWLVDIFSLPVWARWGAFVPSLMATVLLFMDQNITVRLVNAKKHKLKKSSGMHLDMLMISILTFFNSILGFPWLVAATVRSVNHVRSVATFKQTEAGGEVIEKCMESRVTGICIHAMIGLAVLYGRGLLAQVPLAVLMGLFLYLGLSSLGGNQMWERLKYIITDSKMRPKEPWAQEVKYGKSVLFTAIQFACLTGMWTLKSTKIGVLFPVLIAALAPIRGIIEKAGLFSKKEMEVLDSDD